MENPLGKLHIRLSDNIANSGVLVNDEGHAAQHETVHAVMVTPFSITLVSSLGLLARIGLEGIVNGELERNVTGK